MNREFLQEFHLEEPVVEAILEQSGRELADLRFEHLLDAAIGEKKGRSAKAIRAMLDLESLRASEQPEQDIRSALDRLKQDSGYLFETQPPAVYAPGAGAGSFQRGYTQEELGRMSMEEYRAYRRGAAL